MLTQTPFFKGSRAEILGRFILLLVCGLFVVLFLLVPLIAVFSQALSKGFDAYVAAITDEDTRSAIYLTLLSAVSAVVINLIFGLSAAWLVTRFEFPGRKLIMTLIDTPLAVSPVIAGLIFVLLVGMNGLLGPVLEYFDIRIIFATPGIIIATTFVTAPFIARELIPFMMEQGSSEEEAALTLGAKGYQVFRYITLPNIRWALLYGIILCNSRAIGEFGAVSVVSGHIRGVTNTVPLHIEILYNEYSFAAAFAVSSLLALLALGTLVVKSLLEANVAHGVHG